MLRGPRPRGTFIYLIRVVCAADRKSNCCLQPSVCPSIPGIDHSTSVKTTTADSSSLPGFALTAGFPSLSSPVSFWPTHKHARSQLNLICFIPLFSEGVELQHLSLSPQVSHQGFTIDVHRLQCARKYTLVHFTDDCKAKCVFKLHPVRYSND